MPKGVWVRAPSSAPNPYNPNLFPIGDGFGLLVFFERFEDTHSRNGVVKQPEPKPKGPSNKKLSKHAKAEWQRPLRFCCIRRLGQSRCHVVFQHPSAVSTSKTPDRFSRSHKSRECPTDIPRALLNCVLWDVGMVEELFSSPQRHASFLLRK